MIRPSLEVQYRVRLARLVFVVLVALVAVRPPVAAQGLTFVLFERYLDVLRKQGRIPGMSAAVVTGRRIVWERGFGYRDVEASSPATPDTAYLVGDLTQPVSATLLLRCMESGTLRLDDPIGLWTGSGPDEGRTLRQVLAHTTGAGVPAFKYDPAVYAPLSGVISACGGVTYPRALAHQLLDRLAMFDSVPGRDAGAPAVQFVDSERTARYLGVLGRLALPYRVDPGGRTVPAEYPPTGLNAATGLISTVRDLARFDAAIDDDVLLRAETRDLAWTNMVSPSGAAMPAGNPSPAPRPSMISRCQPGSAGSCSSTTGPASSGTSACCPTPTPPSS